MIGIGKYQCTCHVSTQSNNSRDIGTHVHRSIDNTITGT